MGGVGEGGRVSTLKICWAHKIKYCISNIHFILYLLRLLNFFFARGCSVTRLPSPHPTPTTHPRQGIYVFDYEPQWHQLTNDAEVQKFGVGLKNDLCFGAT
jgi:hypothetical protein